MLLLPGLLLLLQTSLPAVELPAQAGLPGAVPVDSQPAAAESQVSIASWTPNRPGAGTLARLRVRGQAVRLLGEADGQWYLTAGGEEVLAALEWPQPIPEPERYELEVASTEARQDGSLVAVIDRGPDPRPLAGLYIELSALDLLARADLASSPDGETYSQLAGPQLIFQRAANAGIQRLTTLACEPGDDRWIRLTITGTGDSQLLSVQGYAAVDDTNDYYEVQASFGPELAGFAPDEQLYPLLLEDPALPVLKLKITGDGESVVRRLSIVRLEDDLSPRHTLATSLWSHNLKLGALQRSDAYIQCYPQLEDYAWGVVVDNGELPPIQLHSVQAYAGQVYIVFSLPPDGVPALLHLGSRPGERLGLSGIDTSALPLAGSFAEVPAQPPTQEQAAATGPPLVMVGRYIDRWRYVLLYGIAGAVLLLSGLVLLIRRRGRRSEHM